MSWKDRLQNIEFTITTGDGKVFTPLWKNGEKTKDFNIAKFDFINVQGSLIERKTPQGSKFPLVFWFQGDDNIEQSNDFENSANDPRLWTVEHPFYGTIKGQPTNIKRNDQNYNITEITVDFWESINADYPNTNISLQDEVSAKVEVINENAINSYTENAKPTTADIPKLKQLISDVQSKFEASQDKFTEYQNIVNNAVKAADNLVTDVNGAIFAVQEVISFPATFTDSVKRKVNSYVDAFNSIIDSIESLNVNSKYNVESQAASAISGMAVSIVNPLPTDYVTRDDIEEINTLLVDTYNNYLEVIDNNQVDIYDVDNAWIPNPDIQINLLNLITFTSNNLFNLSFNARQERTIELESDSNLIILTHRFLGLDANDENITTFRNINNIKNNELFKVQKGRLIKYFV